MTKEPGQDPKSGEAFVEPAIEPDPQTLLAVLRRVAAGSPNALIAVGQDGRIVFVNPRVEAVFGYPPDELAGRPIEDLLPERFRAGHVGQRDGIFLDPHTARPLGIGHELRAKRRNGTEFPVEISLNPVEGPSGRLVLATVVDISARKEAEEALAESERRFRTVLDASPNAIVAIDEHGTIVYANPQVEETFGIIATNLIGSTVETLLPSRVADRHVAHRAAFMANPTARPMGIGLDLAGLRADGTEFPVEISLSPVRTTEGILAFATIVDITARKALEQELLHAQKLESIGRLAGGIAHDFNNMLTAIRGHAEIVLGDVRTSSGPVDASEVIQSVEAIRDASDRAARLTAQLLAFSRQQVLKPRVLEIRSVVDGLQPMLRRLIGERIRLKFAVDPETGRIRADPGQLDQILVNLVVNSRDAMPDGGTITIETGNARMTLRYAGEHFEVPPGDYVTLGVSDDGMGMDQATRQHIFEPFFTTKGIGRGTGLGLATIYGIVRQSGGHISLYSEPGLGTSFKLYFPRVEAPVDATVSRETQITPGRSGTIVVAEDDVAVREVVVRLLTRAGYTVLSAVDGREALDLIASHRADVLVTDVVMPSMAGPDLARAVMERHPETGVVLISGYTGESVELAELVEQGARFVGKPFSGSDLVAAVDEARARPASA